MTGIIGTPDSQLGSIVLGAADSADISAAVSGTALVFADLATGIALEAVISASIEMNGALDSQFPCSLLLLI